jgi:hypothetical protein
MNRRFVHILCSFTLMGQMVPQAMAAQAQPELNFKIYNPPPANDADKSAGEASPAPTPKNEGSDSSMWSPDTSAGGAAQTTEPAVTEPQSKSQESQAGSQANPTTAAGSSETPVAAPKAETPSLAPTAPEPTAASPQATPTSEAPAASQPQDAPQTAQDAAPQPTAEAAQPSADGTQTQESKPEAKKLLKGYIRVVPSGTKIPIIMDTAVDTDTSQEGDEFAARTSEDLNIDGNTVVPAGSVIKGRIAQLNNPKSMGRSGSVALKFDTVTTPDNRQIPIVANLVARGGVVHARRGLKDIALDTGSIAIPTALGIGIGALAGSANSSSGSGSSSHINKGSAALIGAGVGVGIGVAILLIKKGKKVDVRPGDELKIELAEDLRMPM